MLVLGIILIVIGWAFGIGALMLVGLVLALIGALAAVTGRGF